MGISMPDIWQPNILSVLLQHSSRPSLWGKQWVHWKTSEKPVSIPQRGCRVWSAAAQQPKLSTWWLYSRCSCVPCNTCTWWHWWARQQWCFGCGATEQNFAPYDNLWSLRNSPGKDSSEELPYSHLYHLFHHVNGLLHCSYISLALFETGEIFPLTG